MTDNETELPSSEKHERQLEEELEHLEEDVQQQGIFHKLRRITKLLFTGRKS